MSDDPAPLGAAGGRVENDLRYRALFENSVIGIRVSSVADGGRIVEANPAYRRMLGYSAAELAERTIFDLTHPEDREINRQLYAEMLAGRRSFYQIEKRFVRKDGSSFWGRLTAHPLQDEGSQATHHIGMVEDVSERRLAQAALEESTERLQAVLNAALEGIVLIDTAGIIQSVNLAVQKLFGYPPEELLGQNVKILMPQPWREEHDGYLSHYAATGEARIIGIGRQVEGRRRDGSTFPLDLAVSEVRHGGKVFFLGTLRDITERLRLESEIRQAQKMEAIGRLAGGVAHDFNTLLGTIRGYSEMLLGSLPRAEPGRQAAEQIHRAALRGAQLTRQLLLFSRRREMRTQVVDLEKLMAEVEVLLDRLISADISLSRRVEPGIGHVWGDPGELHQVILNLIVNACDAMPSGGALDLSLSNLESSHEIAVDGGRLPPGPYVQLEVKDTGLGMEEETRKRIFEPFFTTKEPGKGTGLGLSTVHAIVRRSQGGIAVESRPAQGTTFYIYLPRAGQEKRERQESATERAGVPADEPGPVRETILLVEDDEMFRGLLRKVLETRGYNVLEAANPTAALDLATAHGKGIQLLLSDLVMPGGQGGDLALRLAARDPELKIILMSGYSGELLSSRDAARPPSGEAFLEKPFASEDLLRLIRKLLDARSAG